MKTLYIIFVVLTGANGMSRDQIYTIIEKSKAHYAEIGINLRARRVYFYNDPTPQSNILSDRKRKFNNLESYRYYLSKRKPLLRSSIVHFILPPGVESDGTRYIWGLSQGVCRRKGISASVAQQYNAKGEIRVEESAVAVSHESAHIYGAFHTTDHTIMDGDALPYSHNGNHFSAESMNQIYGCINNWR